MKKETWEKIDWSDFPAYGLVDTNLLGFAIVEELVEPTIEAISASLYYEGGEDI